MINPFSLLPIANCKASARSQFLQYCAVRTFITRYVGVDSIPVMLLQTLRDSLDGHLS
jgi:hypothetical protein